MKVNESRLNNAAAIIGVVMLVSVSMIAFISTFDEGAEAYSSRKDISKAIPYHAAAQEELTGEASLQMIFDYWGPSVTQQDIRNVTKGGPLDSDVAYVDELVRASHFSDQSWARGNLRGYNERSVGYGGFFYDWNDDNLRVDKRFPDLYEAIFQNFPVAAYMYKDFPPELTIPEPPDPNNPQPPDPQITPEDLAGLEKVWRIVTAYIVDDTARIKVHDPLPPGTGAAGGPDVYFTKDEFDNLWNVYQREEGGGISTHRLAMTAAPWSIHDIDSPKNVEAGTDFEITANITYSAPPTFMGVEIQNPAAFLKLPEDFSMAEGTQNIDLDIDAPGSFDVVNWKVRAPDRTYAGQDYRFYINSTGNAVVSDPAHRDRIGQSANFEVEAYGFLNHPPQITSASIDPDYIPDDGSKQPIITCLPSDEDGNIYRVTIDLSSIGGSSEQRMYDDGRNGGDEVADDGIYSYKITREVQVGEWIMMITVKDSKGAQAYANVTLQVEPLSEFTEKPEFLGAGADPPRVPNDGFTTTTIWAIVEDAENDIDEVVADLSSLGGDNDQKLNDDGDDGDLFSNDGNYSFAFSVGPLIPLDIYQIEITAIDETEHETVERIWIDVILPPVPPVIVDIIVDPDTIVNDGEDEAQIIVTVEDDNDDVEEVWIDLTPLRGSSEAQMSYEGDNTWSLEITAGSSVSPGLKGRIDVTARDKTDLTASEDFSITIEKSNSPPEILDITVSSYNVDPGDSITIIVNVTDADFESLVVDVDLSTFLVSDVALLDDGNAPDETAEDNAFSGTIDIPSIVTPGNHTITIVVRDPKGGETSQDIVLNVREGADNATTKDLDIVLYVGIPMIGLVVLLVLVGIAVARNRRPATEPGPGPMARYPPGRGPPAGAQMHMPGHPLGPRAMR